MAVALMITGVWTADFLGHQMLRLVGINPAGKASPSSAKTRRCPDDSDAWPAGPGEITLAAIESFAALRSVSDLLVIRLLDEPVLLKLNGEAVDHPLLPTEVRANMRAH